MSRADGPALGAGASARRTGSPARRPGASVLRPPAGPRRRPGRTRRSASSSRAPLLPGALVAACALLVALVAQLSLLSRLPLPGTPDAVLVVVVALGLSAGPRAGAAAGFAGGLGLDAWAMHPLGLLALLLAVAGHVAGRLRPAVAARLDVALAVTAVASVAVPLATALLLAATGSRVAGVVDLGLLAGAALDVALAAVVVPLVAASVRRRGRRRT